MTTIEDTTATLRYVCEFDIYSYNHLQPNTHQLYDAHSRELLRAAMDREEVLQMDIRERNTAIQNASLRDETARISLIQANAETRTAEMQLHEERVRAIQLLQ